ncbi:hypothetical protein GW17_00035714 [Ensete ventricosum]|nr:hypothetical protein GW17_00035714 [Ensete ventricosum]
MGTGKSSLVLRFVKGQFLEFQTLAVSDATVKLEIWDTAGQERYHSLAPMYYRGAAAAIIESFERAKKWVQELQKQGLLNLEHLDLCHGRQDVRVGELQVQGDVREEQQLRQRLPGRGLPRRQVRGPPSPVHVPEALLKKPLHLTVVTTLACILP